MDVFNIFRTKIIDIVKKLPLKTVDQSLLCSFQVTTPKEKKFGDISTNIALVLSSALGVNTLELAQSIADRLLTTEKNIISDIDIIKPGFINISLHTSFWLDILNSILTSDLSIKLNNDTSPELVNIEYVSANPTGPMHIGHGRGAVVGDVLANLYSFCGYSVTKEYYINDDGNQIKGLAFSVYYRYCEVLGKSVSKPKDYYPGVYIIDIAKDIINKDGNKWLNISESKILEYFSQYSVNKMMGAIKEDLQLLGIKHDVFSSEKVVSNEETYVKLKSQLKSKDLVYMGVLDAPKSKNLVQLNASSGGPSLLFRTSKFGDDVDRVVEKPDGTKTYFASDISYHYSKLSRGFNKMIVILGADHKGYEKRLQAIVSALSNNSSSLETVFIEMVKLLKNKKPVKMSKRAGEFITLKDILNEVPKDAFKIMMLSRSNSSVLEFDLASVSEKTEKNPVFYIQYAYARIHSVISKAKIVFPDITEEVLIKADKSLLSNQYELSLIKELSSYQKVLITVLDSNNVHLIFLLLLNISKSIHCWWSAGKYDNNLKFIVNSNKKLTFARLSLLLGAKKVMFVLFNIIGIDKPEQM